MLFIKMLAGNAGAAAQWSINMVQADDKSFWLYSGGRDRNFEGDFYRKLLLPTKASLIDPLAYSREHSQEWVDISFGEYYDATGKFY